MRIEDIIKTKKMHSHSRAIINLLYTANVINGKTSEAIKPYDISLPQFNVLRILKGQKGNPANLCTIQERMVAKTSNTTRIVDKLIDKGLVKRMQCPQNRRKVEIFITESGLELIDKASVAVARIEKEVIKDLSDEALETFNHTLDILRS